MVPPALALLTAAGGYEMYNVLKVGGVTILEAMLLGFFLVLLAWIAFSFISAVAGFVVLLARRTSGLAIDRDGPLPGISSRTAMLLPTYNEDPHQLMARLRALMGESRVGAPKLIDTHDERVVAMQPFTPTVKAASRKR